jgi:hypothetical protein
MMPRGRRLREQAQRRRLILTTARGMARSEGWDYVTRRRLADRRSGSGRGPRPAAGGVQGLLAHVLREHPPEAVKVFTGVNGICCGAGSVAWREAYAGLMGVGAWLDRSGWVWVPGLAGVPVGVTGCGWRGVLWFWWALGCVVTGLQRAYAHLVSDETVLDE